MKKFIKLNEGHFLNPKSIKMILVGKTSIFITTNIKEVEEYDRRHNPFSFYEFKKIFENEAELEEFLKTSRLNKLL